MDAKGRHFKEGKHFKKENKMVRKIAAVAVIAAVTTSIIALAACQQHQDTDTESSLAEKYTTRDDTVQAEEGFHYKLTDTSLEVYTSEIDNELHYSGWAEVTNTGTTNIELDTAKFMICDENNTVIQSDDYISAMPKIILPGEKGYWYMDRTLETEKDTSKLSLKPQISAFETTEAPVRLAVSNDTIEPTGDTTYHFTCTVKNTLDHTVYYQYLNVWHLLYNGDKVIGRFCMDSTDATLEPGASKTLTYDFDTNKLPGSLKGSKITNYKILAMEEKNSVK